MIKKNIFKKFHYSMKKWSSNLKLQKKNSITFFIFSNYLLFIYCIDRKLIGTLQATDTCRMKCACYCMPLMNGSSFSFILFKLVVFPTENVRRMPAQKCIFSHFHCEWAIENQNNKIFCRRKAKHFEISLRKRKMNSL